MTRLKGIPAEISPELLYALASMGHGDEIVFADDNFPARSHCNKGAKLIDATCQTNMPALLKSVLKLFPLDTYVFNPAIVMDLANKDKNKNLEVSVWKDYQKVIDNVAEEPVQLYPLERYEFYERARNAYAIVATGEQAPYGNIILKKGCVKSDE